MASRAVELSEGIVRCVNGAPPDYYSLAFNAARRAVPINEVSELNSLQVYVLDATRKTERSTRNPLHPFRHSFKPVVLIQKKLQEGSVESQLGESDALMGLAEEIERRIEQQEPDGFALDGFDENADGDLYNLDVMRAYGVFSRPIILQYTDRT